MFAELNELLGASPQRPEQGKFMLLRDTRTDGSFLVHHFLSFYLRAGCKVCFVALLQSFSHYNIVAQKLRFFLPEVTSMCWDSGVGDAEITRVAPFGAMGTQGVSLTAAKERGQLVFLEGLGSCLNVVFGKEEPEEEQEPKQPHPLQFLSGTVSDLRALFDFVRTALAPAAGDVWQGRVLLVDELGVLLSLGAAPVAVLDFVHYCRVAVCSRLQGNIVVLVHSDEDSEDEENELLVTSMCHHSDLILWAEGLATGFCKDVHGQLKIIRRTSLQPGGQRDTLQLYQYKIQERNVTFFARGMSAAVL